MADIITISVLKKTNVRHIGILYFRFRFPLYHCNAHVILRQATEFRPNRSTHCANITSCRFFKIAAAAAKYYFRFSIC